MKRTIGILTVGVLLLLTGCGGDGYTSPLCAIDSVINEKPDSALRLLDSLSTEAATWPKSLRMRHSLLTLKAQNKADVTFSDSTAKVLVDYFGSHGTTNERMQAYYLLGRAYSDMGEAPRAINSYQNAIDAADTTVTDFDFYTLSCVYSQMATVFYRQLLLTNEIEARRKASYYAFRANKPMWGIYNNEMIAGTYLLMNKKDSAEIILKSVLEQYRKYGYTQQALRSSRMLMHLYTERSQRLDEAKALMDQFEAESELFDKYHELPPSQRQYYNYKGKYYEAINKLDSAEFYYRKIYRPGMSYVSQDPMYRGLLSVFSKQHQADSIAKYAQLYCLANDSSIALKDQDLVAQMAATYNYNRLRDEAHESEVKAYKTLIGLIIVIVLLGILSIIIFLNWKLYQNRIERLKKELADTADEYEENLRELRLLETTHKEEYKSEKSRLLADNSRLQKRINELLQEDVISKHLTTSASFTEKAIVKRFREVSHKPLVSIAEGEWDELVLVFSNSYPTLYHDLSVYCNTPQNIRVCILTALGIGGDEQANMLKTTKQRISNIKSTLNKALFNEASSRTLRRNFAAQYNVYGFERDGLPE